MTPELTSEQRQAIEDRGGAPIYVVDEATNQSYVLMRAEQFETLSALFGGEEFHPREAYRFPQESI